MHARLIAAFASSSLFFAIFASSSTIFVITDCNADYYDKLIPLQNPERALVAKSTTLSSKSIPEHVTASSKKTKITANFRSYHKVAKMDASMRSQSSMSRQEILDQSDHGVRTPCGFCIFSRNERVCTGGNGLLMMAFQLKQCVTVQVLDIGRTTLIDD